MFTILTSLVLVSFIGLGVYLSETTLGEKLIDKLNLF